MGGSKPTRNTHHWIMITFTNVLYYEEEGERVFPDDNTVFLNITAERVRISVEINTQSPDSLVNVVFCADDVQTITLVLQDREPYAKLEDQLRIINVFNPTAVIYIDITTLRNRLPFSSS